MVRRLIAIGFIFVCTSIAWSMLAGITDRRTHSSDENLRRQVERVWGAPQVQQSPTLIWTERVPRNVESVEDGKKVVKTVEDRIARPIPLEASAIEVTLDLEHRLGDAGAPHH
jgi:hypothetical protein